MGRACGAMGPQIPKFGSVYSYVLTQNKKNVAAHGIDPVQKKYQRHPRTPMVTLHQNGYGECYMF